MTKSEYQTKITKLQRIVNKFESRLATKQNGSFGRAVRLLGLALAIADLQMEMFAYAEDDVEGTTQEERVNTMRNRTHEQIMQSKAIYRKHAERYKNNDYPEHRAKRMLAYTAKLSKAIASVMVNRNYVGSIAENPQVNHVETIIPTIIGGEEMQECYIEKKTGKVITADLVMVKDYPHVNNNCIAAMCDTATLQGDSANLNVVVDGVQHLATMSISEYFDGKFFYVKGVSV